MMFDYPDGNGRFYVDKKFNHKLDLMCELVVKANNDIVIISDGAEGTGKSNLLTVTCHLFSIKLNRQYTVDNIYFDLDQMMKDMQSSEEGIFHFDEAALGAMADDWQNKLQKKFRKLLMIARKRKHVLVMAIPQFWRLNRYFAVDRSKALLHTYLKDGMEYGNFAYYTIKGKEILYEEIKRKKNPIAYRAVFKKGKGASGMGGCFIAKTGYHMERLINFQAYDKKKDEAIESLTDDNDSSKGGAVQEIFLNTLERDLTRGDIRTQFDYSLQFDKHKSTISRWFQKQEVQDLLSKYNIQEIS
jgi:hypothetical protein